jgi:hypothetical protein
VPRGCPPKASGQDVSALDQPPHNFLRQGNYIAYYLKYARKKFYKRSFLFGSKIGDGAKNCPLPEE